MPDDSPTDAELANAPFATFRCPKCGHTEHQLPAVRLVAHACPKANRRYRLYEKMVRVESVEEE